jgi:hypothetical protein
MITRTMRLQRPPLRRLVVLVLVCVPALAWSFVKPVRVLVPALAPVACGPRVCVDEGARRAEAEDLVRLAQADVERKVGPLGAQPQVIFCSTQDCADYFGLGRRSAVTLGTVATVIGPRAWKPYYVRHELLHHAQAQHIGVVPLLLKPGWIVEGMAYGLSDDPRTTLAEPFQSQRRQFMAWYAKADPTQFWTELARQ